MTNAVNIFVRTWVSILSGTHARVGLLGHRVTLVNFVRTGQAVFHSGRATGYVPSSI